MSSMWTYYFIMLILLVHGVDVQKLEGGDRIKTANKGICESMDIRNNAQKLEILKNCTIIVGYLQIVLLEGYTESTYSNYSFPDLREVTQFVLLYRVGGVQSLGELFPNLSLIRGQKLFHNYALIIFELQQLKEIGLRSLTIIQRGYVRIAQNPQLCYSKSVDWEEITNRTNGHYIHANGEKFCPGSQSCRGCDRNLCWSSKFCQKLPSPSCHPECLGGCTLNLSKCYSCRNFVDDGICVPKCPPEKFEHPATSICLTLEQCSKMYRGTGWTWGKICIRRCPKSYKMIYVNGSKTCEFCGNRCNVTCMGNEVQTLDEVQYYKGCNFVTGSLHIRFVGENNYSEDVMQELTDSFQDIQEIKGMLKVFRSSSITSLNFLKNLTVIHGSELMYNRYALAVHEMNNLQTLWDDDVIQKLKILNGTILFHYNAKLCLKEIDKLKSVLKLDLLPDDVSHISNGYESHCHFVNIQTDSKILSSKTVTITWDSILYPNQTQVQLGYLIYYMEEPEDMNLTHSSRDTCYDKGWRTVYVEEPVNRSIERLEGNLTNLTPYTKYAYYVESYYKSAIMSYALHDGQSEIKYFKTEMEDPKMPIELEATSSSYNELTVTWEDDPSFRGVITHYLVEIVLQKDEIDHLDKRNYCIFPPLRELPTVKHKSQSDTTEEESKPKKTRKCYCTKEEWNKYVQDEELLNVSRIYAERNNEKFKAWCLQSDMRGPPQNIQEFLDELKCKEFLSGDYEDDDKTHSRSERNANYAFDIQKVVGEATPRPPIENVTVNNVHYSYSTRVFGRDKKFTLSDLKNYGQYLVYVSACKGSSGDCGAYEVIAHRTKDDPVKDNIGSLSVKVLSSNTAEVSWDEPRDPNGAVVSYTLEYFRDNQHANNSIVHCITRQEHDTNKFKYSLLLIPGKYGIRVRAHSLARDGDYTQIYYFSTESQYTVGWLIFLGVLLIIAVSASIIWYWYYYTKRIANNVDVARLVTPSMAVRYYDYGSDEDLDRIDFYNMENN